MSNECLVKNVFESNGTSMLDGCGIGRPIPTKWRVFFCSSKTTWPTMLMTCVRRPNAKKKKKYWKNWTMHFSFLKCAWCRVWSFGSYLEWSAFDVDISSATCQCALDANHHVAIMLRFVALWLMAIAQQVTQLAMIALMCVVPHLLPHYVNLKTTQSTIFCPSFVSSYLEAPHAQLHFHWKLNDYLLNSNDIVYVFRNVDDIAIRRQYNEKTIECLHDYVLFIVGK